MSSAQAPDNATHRNRKFQTFAALGIAKNGDTTDIASVVPLSAGNGAPNHNAHVAGEIYIRTDGTAAAGTAIYIATNTSGTWAPLVNLSALAPTAISLTDNSATALQFLEGANPYLTFDTANSSESVRIHKILELLAGGIDMSQGAAGQAVYLKDNESAALDVTEGANSYIKCVTTNSSESVTIGKPLLMQGGIAPGSKFVSTEQTGTGSSQDIAHGLGSAPSLAWWAPSSLSGNACTFVPGAHDATNIKMTVTAGEKFYVFALK